MITAEEFLKVKCYITSDGVEDVHDSIASVRDAMISFASMHVEAALKEASEKVKTKTHEEYISKSGGYEYTQYPDKDSILNAYPLTKIL